jgi:hypothetical protein
MDITVEFFKFKYCYIRIYPSDEFSNSIYAPLSEMVFVIFNCKDAS